MNKFITLGMAALLAACQQTQKEQYSIDGMLTGDNIETGMAYLQKYQNGEYVRLDSAVVENGVFTLKGKVDYPEMYNLCIELGDQTEEESAQKILWLNFYLENSPISIEGDANTLPEATWNPDKKYTKPVIRGSKTEDLYQQLNQSLKAYDDSIVILNNRYGEEYYKPQFEKNSTVDYDKAGIAIVKEEQKQLALRQEKILEFIKQNPTSVVALDQIKMILSGAFTDFTVQQIDDMYNLVAPSWQGTQQLQELSTMINTVKPLAMGEKYIDIDVQTPDGKMVKLSSLIPEGKYTMLEFWASWCGPCRAEIPHLRKVNKQYKDFAIISISVDEKEKEWQKAMKEEKMIWTQARITDGIMGETVKKYNLTGVPTCIILDKEGRFYKTNMRGAYLDNVLQELYGE